MIARPTGMPLAEAYKNLCLLLPAEGYTIPVGVVRACECGSQQALSKGLHVGFVCCQAGHQWRQAV